MDDALRVALWNALTIYFRHLREDQLCYLEGYAGTLKFHLWTSVLKQPYDRIPPDNDDFWEALRRVYFSKDNEWYHVYDILQGAVELRFNEETDDLLTRLLNAGLERENAGYRVVNGQFATITSEQELEEVRVAGTTKAGPLAPVRIHLQKALEHLSDRRNPDYRNSMKESITAVEVLCRHIAGMPDATLMPALEKTVKELGLTEEIREGYRHIYKYTCDKHGIRHGLKTEEHPEQEDARFMLVTCSAFVNFLIEKARKRAKLPQ